MRDAERPAAIVCIRTNPDILQDLDAIEEFAVNLYPIETCGTLCRFIRTNPDICGHTIPKLVVSQVTAAKRVVKTSGNLPDISGHGQEPVSGTAQAVRCRVKTPNKPLTGGLAPCR